MYLKKPISMRNSYDTDVTYLQLSNLLTEGEPVHRYVVTLEENVAPLGGAIMYNATEQCNFTGMLFKGNVGSAYGNNIFCKETGSGLITMNVISYDPILNFTRPVESDTQLSSTPDKFALDKEWLEFAAPNGTEVIYPGKTIRFTGKLYDSFNNVVPEKFLRYLNLTISLKNSISRTEAFIFSAKPIDITGNNNVDIEFSFSVNMEHGVQIETKSYTLVLSSTAVETSTDTGITNKLFSKDIITVRCVPYCESTNILNSNGQCTSNHYYYLFFLLAIPVMVLLVLLVIVATVLAIYCSRKASKIQKQTTEKLLFNDSLGDDSSNGNSNSSSHSSIVKSLNNSTSNLFEINFEDISGIEQIGTGGSGAIVFKAMYVVFTCCLLFIINLVFYTLFCLLVNRWKMQHIVVKLFHIKELSDDSKLNEFKHELTLMSGLNHPNIVHCYGACLKQPRIGICMEYCEKGSLSRFITQNSGRIDFATKIKILHQIATGMLFLHSRNIIHRDLKCDNILLDGYGIAKISDFGISRTKDAQANMTQLVGTSSYMAPEIALNEFYDEKCDVFSFAIIMFELLVETTKPYGTGITFNIELRVAKNPLYRPVPPPTFELKEEYVWYIELMSCCWKHFAKDRKNFQEILEELQAHMS